MTNDDSRSLASLLSAFLLAAALVGCGGPRENPLTHDGGTGGKSTSGSGGSQSGGGSGGGAVATGGQSETGSGGQPGSGGATAGSGGNASATGGSTAGTGGSGAGTGGRLGTGGGSATGGAGGGAGAGGRANTGGTVGSGGASASGGRGGTGGVGTGGAPASGGRVGTGGANTGGAASGGRGTGGANTGGANTGGASSGGAPGSGGAPVTFRALGFLTGYTTGSVAEGVSGDGTVVVGASRGTGSQERGFKWTLAGGMTGMPLTTGDCNHVYAANQSGLVVVGQTSSGCTSRSGAIWAGTSLSVLQGLVSLGTARALNSDGTMVVGSSENAQENERAVRWPNSGVPQLVHPSGPVYSYARGVTPDGLIIVGATSDPTYAFRWTSGTGAVLMPGGENSEANAISTDGNVVVGYSGSVAVRWVGSAMPASLGAPGNARAVNSDGSVIVGNAGSEAFIWSASTGLTTVSSVVTAAGVSLAGWTLSVANGVSANGKVIVGNGTHNGATEAWYVRLP